MDVMSQDLTVAQSTVLDGAGYGVIRFAPAGTEWIVKNISVICTTAINEATATIYKGHIGSLYRESGTYAGSTGDANNLENPIQLTDGKALYVVWEGGDAGATATATLSISKTVPANRGFRAVGS